MLEVGAAMAILLQTIKIRAAAAAVVMVLAVPGVLDGHPAFHRAPRLGDLAAAGFHPRRVGFSWAEAAVRDRQTTELAHRA